MDNAIRDTKIQIMLFYIFFKLSKLTDFWKCTPILHEYLESLFYFAFWSSYWTPVGGGCLFALSSSLTLSHQNVFSSYKHCHCSE